MRKSRESGMALILCTIFIALTLVLLSTLSTRLVSQAKHVARAEQSVRVLAAAQNAVRLSIASLEAGGSGSLGHAGTPSLDANGGFIPPFPDSPEAAPLAALGMPEVQYVCMVTAVPGDGVLQAVHAVAWSGDVLRRVEVVLRETAAAHGRYQILSWRERSPGDAPPIPKGGEHPAKLLG